MDYKSIRSWQQLVLIFFVMVLAGCSDETGEQGQNTNPVPPPAPAVEAPAPEPHYISVLPQEAYQLIQNNPELIVVDVRTPEERKEARIKDSVAVSFMDIVKGDETLPKDKPLLLVCAVGGRSYGAGLYLQKRGYPFLYNLRGGIMGWYKEGLPLVTGE
ncbi:rhodanese-like domain-containing protein [Desulfopila sp. IMCC35008]|uniref:rhodanese-like domain-containing protein n=1 Tax=Desulfopila sp. IMCC35008 TaxID=2653858 RepID=UPI0013D42241|nr:rhodanese-like domain-containing protein [Desulfopila sp. IMCC35008]